MKDLAMAYAMNRRKKMAEGGMTKAKEDMVMRYGEPEMPRVKMAIGGDLVDRVMRKRMSEGGKIANGGDDELDRLADSDPTAFDDLALDDSLESNSGGDGDHLGDAAEDHDRDDIVARVMRMRKMKDRNPSPT